MSTPADKLAAAGPYFHGGEHRIKQFGAYVTYFTPSLEVAKAYAHAVGRLWEAKEGPFVMEVTLHCQRTLTVTREELFQQLEVTGEAELDRMGWPIVDEWAYRMAEQGYDSIRLVGLRDYIGMRDGVRQTAVYDQVIVWDSALMTVKQVFDLFKPNTPFAEAEGALPS